MFSFKIGVNTTSFFIYSDVSFLAYFLDYFYTCFYSKYFMTCANVFIIEHQGCRHKTIIHFQIGYLHP